ncbi:MAG: YggS family pyridoxal phosphate-dependent enzyme [Nitrospirae bacterium]|nr:YggS family pyridoxal phosphate-dependent enzyme [Nitrospirota bacterium]
MSLAACVYEVKERMAGAAKRAGRDPGEITIVAVTKGVDVGRIREAIAAGLSICGESRVQEAMPKLSVLHHAASWHFIGHLQKNKVKYIAGKVDLIHSVDSIDLCEEISLRAQKRGIIQNILLEVNISGEEEKFGVLPSEVADRVKTMVRIKGVSLKGMMAIPPFSEDPEQSRPYFRRLRELRDEIVRTGISPPDFRELSMGMSNDFEVGVEEGATLVRIGTAIFGQRG